MFQAAIKALPDFNPIHVYSPISGNSGIAIEARADRIATTFHQYAFLIDGSSILHVEIVKDNVSIQKTNRGGQAVGAAVGGVMLGPVGILLGGLTGSKRTEEKVTKLSLRISTNNISFPTHEIIFLDSPGTNADSPFAKHQAMLLNDWYARVRTVMAS